MNTRTFFSILILSISSTIAFANVNESSFTVVAGENANIFKVVYKSASANRVQVSILNNNNEVVFSESFNKMNGFSRPYNFNGLPERSSMKKEMYCFRKCAMPLVILLLYITL